MKLTRRDLKRLFEKAECEIITIEQTKHWHVNYSFRGKEFFTVCPCTPSGSKWTINKYHEIRRSLRVAGLIK